MRKQEGECGTEHNLPVEAVKVMDCCAGSFYIDPKTVRQMIRGGKNRCLILF